MVGRNKNRKTEIDRWLVGWIYKLYLKKRWMDGQKKIYSKIDGCIPHT